ncbi:alpha/beta hydrolase family protein [Parasediminibacterium sp. JCM 36343]|uniref:alpha/beta hydrolase family protein n=1 Tax=Parasediminibacterium sp. JCM 36343 TaxID=3374279 RepID=UPI00397A90C5
MKRIVSLFLIIVFAFLTVVASAQETGYRVPAKEISDLLLATPTPLVSISGKANWLLICGRTNFTTVEELGQPEVRVAGLRINPNNFSLSRQNFYNSFILKNTKTGKEYPIAGLPAKLAASQISWNSDENKIAFVNTIAAGVFLYVIDVAAQKASIVSQHPLNTVLGNAFAWVDGSTLLYKTINQPASAAPIRPIKPSGPATQQSSGKAAPSATYEDLIKTHFDEQLFAFYTTSNLAINKGGVETVIGKAGIYSSFTLSPNKKYFLARSIHKPFSYLVTASGFPSNISIYDLKGQQVKVLNDLPSEEGTPSGYDNVQDVPRAYDWRNDEPATITWARPVDSGLIKKKSIYRDAVYSLEAPFTGEPKLLFKTKSRYQGTTWCDSTLALVRESSRAKQTTTLSRYNTVTGKLEEVYTRNTTDAYNNIGTPVLAKNKLGQPVIQTTDNGTKILMNNDVGSSPKGDLPFLSKFDLSTKQNEIIWRSPDTLFEYVVKVVDAAKMEFITRRESQQTPPAFYLKSLLTNQPDKLLVGFPNPYPGLEGVTKQKIQYMRADSIALTGDLYLPKGFTPQKDSALPVFIWAYPREFNVAADAGQVRGSQYRFTTLSWASPVYLVTQGYAVLDNAEMPIVAKAGQKPNDNFVEQLRLNAEAAINKLVELGVGDRNRMAVGGHSYGAFMTANLLAHTNLFKAGIARSGAYNRTLTPFGFQNEDRTYWKAPQLYYEMSPFSYADKIKTPLLLIHGDADDNPGTFPINSERLYNAIKGNGGTARLVMLPYEAHHYDAKENVLHMLWEMTNWLDKYVK